MEYFRYNGVKLKISWIAEHWLIIDCNNSVLADSPSKSAAIEQACKVYDYSSSAGISYLEARRNLDYK